MIKLIRLFFIFELKRFFFFALGDLVCTFLSPYICLLYCIVSVNTYALTVRVKFAGLGLRCSLFPIIILLAFQWLSFLLSLVLSYHLAFNMGVFFRF